MNRDHQREILRTLATCFPEHVNTRELPGEPGDIRKTLLYLEQHGLVQNAMHAAMGGKLVIAAAITAQGLDFLEDDGGLSAILGTVTVRLHADTVRDLLSAKIAASDLPHEEKTALTDHLRQLPAEGLKHLTTRLLDLALDRLPDAIPLLTRLLGP